MKNEHVERLTKFLLKVQSGVLPLDNQTQKWKDYNKEFAKIQIKAFKLVTQINFKDLRILDVGFGLCESLSIFVEEGAKATGICLSDHDLNLAKEKGYDVYIMDQSFTEFEDEIFDVVWSKHCLEHSIMPAFTLYEYYRIMKNGAYLYVEVPAPQTKLNHQDNPEHFSVFTKACWLALMGRTGFKTISCADIKFDIMTKEGGKDLYYSFILRKG